MLRPTTWRDNPWQRYNRSEFTGAQGRAGGVWSGLAALAIALFGAAPLMAPAPADAAAAGSSRGGDIAGFARIGRAATLPPHATILHAVPAATELRVDIVMQPRDTSAFAAYAAAVSSPKSPFYRHYLTPAMIGRLFAPSPAQRAFLAAALSSEGLIVGRPTDEGFVIPVSARAVTMERAFRMSLLAVRLRGGTIGRLATSAPALPAAVAPSVAAVIGLDDLVRPRALGLLADRASGGGSGRRSLSGRAPARNGVGGHEAAPATASTGGPGTCAAATQVAAEAAGYTPDEIAKAYGFDGLYRSGDFGAGQTVDLFELDPFELSDIAAYDKCIFGVSHASQVKEVAVDGGIAPGVGGGEAALDIELVSALAPGADIDVYEAPLGDSIVTSWIDEIAAIVAQDNASVVSMSYGFCETFAEEEAPGLLQAENVLFEQAALEGQSWFVAAGDDGSETCFADTGSSELSVADPASQPFVTSVGGTSILAATDPPTEKVWNDGGVAGLANFGAGGGGISSVWPMPSWQSGLDVPGVINSYTSGTPCDAPNGVDCREVPDVSASADEFHGDSIMYDGLWTVFGGTSAAAPKWAAVAALTNEQCEAEHGSEIGFANPALYQIASNPTSYAAAFNDVTVGNNDVLGSHQGAYPATVGYDMATGLGTPRVTSPTGGPALASLLCADGSRLSPRPVLSSVSPAFGSYLGGTAVTITGTDLAGVTAVNFGSAVAPVVPADINSAGTQLSVVTPVSPVDPVPPGLPVGGVIVTVAGPHGTSVPTPLAEFHFVNEVSNSPVPTVSYVGPSVGNAAGGTKVDIIGSGFEEGLAAGTKPTVSFGGVAVGAASVTVMSDSEITVLTPPEPPAADCATYPAVAESNICQVEVTVGNENGTSPTDPILPAPTGSTLVSQPPNTELVAAPTEFDYAPTPTTSSISPAQLPLFPNPPGLPIVTVEGSGFNFLTFLGVIFGIGSYAYDDLLLTSIEPDQIGVEYVGFIASPTVNTFPVSVRSYGGTSNSQTVTVLNPPDLDSLTIHTGPDSGGTQVNATGSGFVDLENVEFFAVIEQSPALISGTENFTVKSSTSLTFVTPASLAMSGFFAACNAAGCSLPIGPSVAFTYFEPLRPVIASISPPRGRAAGGGFVTITGTGLGSVVAVRFGRTESPVVGNPQEGPPGSISESDTRAFAQIPPGKAGTTVQVSVTTPAGTSATSLPFTYVKSPPAAPTHVSAHPGGGSIVVSWTPPTSDGGSPIERYVVSAIPFAGRVVVVGVAPSVHRVVLAPLSPGVFYQISVAVVNAVGRSATVGPTVAPRLGDNGYVVVGSSGYAAGFGSLGGAPSGVAGRTLPGVIVGIAGTPDGQGYWLAGADGSVYPLGTAHDFGSVYRQRRGSAIVGIAATPDGEGYWLVGASGRVFAFGDAKYHGSLAGKRLGTPIVAIAATPDGKGYWLVGSDGRVFAFGDAKYHGSLAGKPHSGPIVAIAATPDGRGYWLLASDGDVYPLGSARYEGGAQGLLGGAAAAIGL